MWVTVPSTVRITQEAIDTLKENGLLLTGRFKNSGKYKKIELAVPGEKGHYTNYSSSDLDVLKDYFGLPEMWRLRGRK